ncbi:transketolase [Actinacidiphila oryziradicis]|uniref:transketolase n=1 Tax=Actinacidiphila oryziradicis TaxID=2571141 RepID=UPI001FE9DACD
MNGEFQRWRELGQQLRVDSIRAAAAAGSGHPTSSMSAADLMAVLLAKYLRYDFDQPTEPLNDHLIFSKGHASPLLYALYKAAGAISDTELLSFRKLGSRLEGHPTPGIPWVDVATGSLGQGLPCGVGLALAGKRLDRVPYRVWVLCGDSEMAEGSIWEAFDHAGHEQLDNLIAIIDVNRLGQRGETMLGWDTDTYVRRAQAFGWRAIEIDGHDVGEIDRAYEQALAGDGRPVAIIARTVKGKGVSAVENRNGFHGKPLADPKAAIRELGGLRELTVRASVPAGDAQPHRFETHQAPAASWKVGDQVATRRGFGEALATLAASNDRIVALDGEVGNSTYTELFADAHPERYFEMYIAEQQLVATAVGFQVRGWVPFAATFAAFLSRAYDFIRMAAVSRADIRLVGSHCGVSIGEDGPSQMGLEDIAALRAVHGSTVLYPCCANQTAKLVQAMAAQPGISYLRTTRAATPVLYAADEEFEIGGSRVVRSSDRDQVTLVAAGITLHEALAAADELAAEKVAARVVDLYSVKPIDERTLIEAAEATGLIVTVEDHHAEGGIGNAVLEVFADHTSRPRIVTLAVRVMPTSGTPAELLAQAGIDGAHIAQTVRERLAAAHTPTPRPNR